MSLQHPCEQYQRIPDLQIRVSKALEPNLVRSTKMRVYARSILFLAAVLVVARGAAQEYAPTGAEPTDQAAPSGGDSTEQAASQDPSAAPPIRPAPRPRPIPGN